MAFGLADYLAHLNETRTAASRAVSDIMMVPVALGAVRPPSD